MSGGLAVGFCVQGGQLLCTYYGGLPPLLLITTAYAVVDLFSSERRKQDLRGFNLDPPDTCRTHLVLSQFGLVM